MQEVGLLQKLVKDSEAIKAKNIAKFFEKIKSFENENKDSDVRAAVDYIDLLLEVGESSSVTDGDWQENNSVNILTVHSAKGLEFPVVFLVNLVSERFPGRERSEQIPIPKELIKEVLPEGDFHLEEERRLFYVGMTRAKEKLYFSAADFYTRAKRKKKMSPFIFEALGKIPDDVLQKMPSQIINYQKPKNIVKKQSMSKLKVDYLTVSRIETFKECPLHYKLKYIYKIPSKTSASSSFGVSIHDTLKSFYQKVKEGNKPTEKLILDLYKANWSEEGFDNKKHKLEFYDKGKTYLLGFLKNGFNPNFLPILMEENFTVPINSTLKIGGKIDRVDDLGNGKFELIDYKTGAHLPTQKDVDRDLQLSFYALALSSIKNVNPENIKLSLYYLDTQEKFSTTRTVKDLAKVKDEILTVRDEIENSDFKCNRSYFCQNKCEFALFCKSD
jgi:DNA helicase-2/ATP-dependent DNA helicase PcrA